MFIEIIGPELKNKELVTIEQARDIAGVSRRTIYNWIKSNKVDYTRNAGNSIRIIRDTLFKLNDGD